MTAWGEPVVFMQLSRIVAGGGLEVGPSFNYPDKGKKKGTPGFEPGTC